MSTIDLGTTDLGLFTELLKSEAREMTPEVARYFLGIEFPTTHQERMHQLGEKAQNGTLSPAEGQQLDRYLNVTHVLGILKSRARRTLRDAGQETA
jgi:hypothetical protein